MTFESLVAQCVMCYRTAAAQQSERSRVLNIGILILLIPPILVIAGLLWLAVRKNRQPEDERHTQERLPAARI
jgi:flagellar basal body-associated protein FliL